MKKILLNTLAVFQIISITVSGILLIILKTATNIKFFEKFYTKNNIAQTINLDNKQLMYYTNNLLNYLNNKEELNSLWYTKKDILHMIDVKNLYNFSYNLLLILITITITIFIVSYFINGNKLFYIIIKIFNKVFIIFFSTIILILTFAIKNFNYFWIKFHTIIFNNDLWLLSLDESNLIKMFPENFFFKLVLKIITNILIYLIILIYLRYKIKKILKIK